MHLRRLFKGKVGNGNNISFWIDPWLLNLPLMIVCPNLFRCDADKRCKVSDRLKVSEAGLMRVWKWKRATAVTDYGSEWEIINSLLNVAVLSKVEDSWVWIGIGKGDFSISSIRKQLYLDMDCSNFWVFEWCKLIPKKCNIFGWRAEMGRIPTALALRHRNIPIADVSCLLCGSAEESVDHLFTGCIIASRLWQHISSWCKTQDIFAFSFKSVEVNKFLGVSGAVLEIFMYFIIRCWCIWKREILLKSKVEARIGQRVIGESKF
ncbi:RNA-directed DNA polymerase, eukaryota [Artemisia annua]|uniref:RNA-directed DNA polymerase, eukaryota n=1 Tax=Artemisia annua TaxID=35608 RepID=A0A2U1QNR9_ARTAN|nr:RNA-directed DNA polymerase, eukaryota [Artemisia annua]